MTISAVQNVHVNSGAETSVVLPLTSTTSAGNTLFALYCLEYGTAVESVIDNAQNRWIQAAYASSPLGGNVELWVARGIQGGNVSVASTFSAASVSVNVSEFSGCWFQSPLDTWSQNIGIGASVLPQNVSPRMAGELVLTVANSSASISNPTGGFTSLHMPGRQEYAAGYDILTGSTIPATRYNALSGASWAVLQASFMPGPVMTVAGGGGGGPVEYRNTNAYRNSLVYPGSSGGGASVVPIVQLNPLLQFPETMVQLCTSQNYLAPMEGVGIWVDVSSYVEAFTVGPIGRQHELDRVQASSGQFTVNGRDGTFNPWNTESFLYPGGLDPMTPVRVMASWAGVTSAIAYLYAQSFDPVIKDSQNVDVTISAYDILQMLSLSYLSSNNYAQAVLGGN